MSRLLFWLRRFRMSAQGWWPQPLVRFFLIAPSIILAEVRPLFNLAQHHASYSVCLYSFVGPKALPPHARRFSVMLSLAISG